MDFFGPIGGAYNAQVAAFQQGGVFGSPAQIDTSFHASNVQGAEVSLGTATDKVIFQGLEIPQDLPIGGPQMIAVHKFPGGNRSIDDYGEDFEPISFSGTLLSEVIVAGTDAAGPSSPVSALKRATTLNRLKRQGTVLQFIYQNFRYEVKIAKFVGNVKHQNRVDYSIELEVLRDLTNPNDFQTTAVVGPGFKTAADGLIQSVTKLVHSFDSILAYASAITNILNAIIQNPGQYLTTKAAAQLALNQFQNLTGTLWPQLALDFQNAQPYETLASTDIQNILVPEMTAVYQNIGNILSFTLGINLPFLSSFSAAQLYPAKAALGQSINNMKNLAAPDPNAARVVTVLTPNLYQLATQYYGDPNQWNVIAAANGLSVPNPVSQVQPPAVTQGMFTPATSGGAIPPGSYKVVLTLANSVGETTASNELTVVVAGSGAGSIAFNFGTALPAGTNGKLYISQPGGGPGSELFALTVPATGKITLQTLPLQTSTQVPPVSNTANLPFTLTIPNTKVGFSGSTVQGGLTYVTAGQ